MRIRATYLLIMLAVSASGCGIVNEQERRHAYVDAHPELSPPVLHAILDGKIMLGMTTREVAASIGRPWEINRSVYEFGVHEQWVYGSYYDHWYAYFEDGRLTSWQD